MNCQFSDPNYTNCLMSKIQCKYHYCIRYNLSKTKYVRNTNSMEQSPSWEANSHSASQEIPSLYGNRRFVTVYTRARSNPRVCVTFRNELSFFFLRWVGSPSPKLQAGQSLHQCIWMYPAVSYFSVTATVHCKRNPFPTPISLHTKSHPHRRYLYFDVVVGLA
jgi:hypothetical protein